MIVPPSFRLVNLIISEAVEYEGFRYSTIEPFEDRVRVRYRIDGILVERDSPPRRLLGCDCLTYQDYEPGVDISEKRRPQDGRIKNDNFGEGLRLTFVHYAD